MREFGFDNRIYTEEEYLEMDEKSEVPLEFYDGIIVPRGGGSLMNPHAMAGATEKHVSLASQFARALNNRLDDSKCQAGQSDLRVKVQDSKKFYYPDVAVWCDDARFEDKARRTLLTPLVIVEVLSASTAHIDRGSKLEIYQQIPTLLDYLLVSQNRVYIAHYRRLEGERWENVSYYQRDQIIRLGALQLEIPVGEIYRRVDVPEQLVIFEIGDD
ncbi:Endonuclease, Uma2 family (restriction endonuclease fold) [Abditibacterium utsteinense]|uniref:Endonuclease, Uma2 family (Restriction endonuclease fold) n=1 Tax=Abditibacterium utsteinense TaxID=1960156 RepID=A0A2S8SSW9_9BACT|nr:Uma2 family endonuclease [Abditibacterium utsteinense]PQV63914.1 Endonuclease, Uma2 family (restriction endonuclease fold) [Abditibacterium utsteinense]